MSATVDEPLGPEEAATAIGELMARPNVRTPAEQAGFWNLYRTTSNSQTRGNHVPDAHLAALMRQHGVRVIYTRDRDFRRYDGIEVRDLPA